MSKKSSKFWKVFEDYASNFKIVSLNFFYSAGHALVIGEGLFPTTGPKESTRAASILDRLETIYKWATQLGR